MGVHAPVMPLYERVALDLTRALFAEPPPDGKLPAEMDLCLRFGVSRTTLRRAIDELELRGLIVRRHAIGTFFVGGNVMPPPSEPVARSSPAAGTRSQRSTRPSRPNHGRPRTPTR
jgi:DNA-binding GntR family transcriptional regulator